jgi:hypothetical protein
MAEEFSLLLLPKERIWLLEGRHDYKFYTAAYYHNFNFAYFKFAHLLSFIRNICKGRDRGAIERDFALEIFFTISIIFSSNNFNHH